jgi:aromatic ring-opening dioxygenase catalytic subunit (LigB family)
MLDQAIAVAASKSQVCITYSYLFKIAHFYSQQPHERKQSLFDLMKHDGFAQAHPSAEHFVPLYVAAGAGEEGGVQIVSAIYSAPTIAFGI